jgi:hypothetical protein
LKALGQAEAAKRDEGQKILLSQLLLKTSNKSNTEEYADNYKPHNDDGLQDDEPQEDELQEDEDEPQYARYLHCLKMRMTVMWMTTVG